jgi:hypothetical protein
MTFNDLVDVPLGSPPRVQTAPPGSRLTAMPANPSVDFRRALRRINR